MYTMMKRILFKHKYKNITCEDERGDGGYVNRRIAAAKPL